jgi:TRAP-type C4-dicarboxylate transport system permease small subunit
VTFDRIVRFFAILAGIDLFALMLLTVYSVVMRYVFNAPPFFTLDLSQMMLIPVVFFGLAYCGWTGGHIAVDLVGTLKMPALERVVDVVVRLVCAAVIALWSWKLVGLALNTQEIGNATNLVQIPYYPFVWVMVAGSALLAVSCFGLALRSLRGREDPPSS